MIYFVFYVYRPLQVKMPKALTADCWISSRELVLGRKYGKPPANPRNEGFTWRGSFYCFRLKISTSYNIYYHSISWMNHIFL